MTDDLSKDRKPLPRRWYGGGDAIPLASIPNLTVDEVNVLLGKSDENTAKVLRTYFRTRSISTHTETYLRGEELHIIWQREFEAARRMGKKTQWRVPSELVASPISLEVATMTSPPRMLEKFLWLTLPSGVRDALLGDAEEAFNATLPKYGLRAAQWDYVKEVVFGVGGALLMLYAKLQGKFKQRQ